MYLYSNMLYYKYIMCLFLGTTLRNVLKTYPTKRIAAGLGGNSLRNKLLGEYGEDIEVTVPVGITVIDEHGRHLGK